MGRDTELPTGTLTFLFTDIEGSTRLLHELGESYDAALVQHRELLRASFERHHGRELNTEGDAFFVAFERASDAVAAALSFQLDLGAHKWPHEAIKVRAGLHTGEVRVVDNDLVGMAIHEAARIASAAHGGQVLVSAMTAELASDAVPDGAAFADVGRYRLKDIVGETRLLEVLHPRLRAFGRCRLAVVRPNNLPIPATSLVGRDHEVEALVALASSPSVVTIAGTAGAGKTRLAIALGHEMLDRGVDGVWFVDLSAALDESFVWDALARATGTSAPDGETKAAVLDALGGTASLVILDNCEHVADVAAEVCGELRTRCLTLRVVATSREPLDVDGEAVWRVPALDETSAAALFAERAQHVNSSMVLDDVNNAAIGRICRRLDGLPLAIELAAMRSGLLSPIEIEERLEDRFRLLTGGARANARQQTLRAAIDWSYDHLNDDEQLLFRRMSIFAGSFSLDAVTAVCDFDAALKADAVDVAGALVNRSLLSVEYVEGRSRYRLLESLREYGEEALTASGEATELSMQHLRWFASWADETLNQPSSSVDVAARIEAVQRNIENIGKALAWSTDADREAGLRLAVALGPYWRQRAFGEGYDAVASLLDAAPAETELRARALLVLGVLASCRGASHDAVARLEEAFAIDATSPRWRGEIAYQLADVIQATDPSRSSELLTRAAALFESEARPDRLAAAFHNLAILEFNAGSGEAAYQHLLDALSLATDSHDDLGASEVLGTLALVDNYSGDPDSAYARVARLTDLAERLNNVEALVRANTIAAQIDAYNGKLRAAAQHNRNIIELFDVGAVSLGVRNQVRCELASMLMALGEYDEARGVLTDELSTLRPDAEVSLVRATSLLGLLELYAGRFEVAFDVLQRAVTTMNDAGIQQLVDDPSADVVAALCALERYDEARTTLDALTKRDPELVTLTTVALLIAEDRVDEACRCLASWLEVNPVSSPLAMAGPLEMSTHVLARATASDTAAELLGASLASYESLDLAEGAPACARRERTTKLLVDRMGPSAFDAACKRGAALSIDDAFALATSELAVALGG